ncbi:MAG: hypothetical protein ABJN69_00615 [Hellea sp.]
MSHNFTKTAIMVAAAVSLTGCAQLGKMGGDMWGYTKSAASFVSSPVTKLLRSAPEHDYVFDGTAKSQHAAKAAFAQDGNQAEDAQPRGELVMPAQLAQLPVPQTPNYQDPVYGPDSYQSVYGNPPVAPARVVQAQPQAPLAAPQTTQDISFVKMGGGSNMQDWTMCEAEAGGFVRVVQGGYLIDPGFESCMRAKGYKPESEVADQISL